MLGRRRKHRRAQSQNSEDYWSYKTEARRSFRYEECTSLNNGNELIEKFFIFRMR